MFNPITTLSAYQVSLTIEVPVGEGWYLIFNALVVQSKPHKKTIQPSNKYPFDIISVSGFGNNEGYLQGFRNGSVAIAVSMVGDAINISMAPGLTF